MKRYDRAVLVLLLLVFAAGIVFSARNAMTPYVTFAEARKMDRTVQVKGLALSESLTALADGYSFRMEDDNGEVVRVLVAGSVPDNLFAGESIVVTGSSPTGFAAAQVLVKCPSKYEAEKHLTNQKIRGCLFVLKRIVRYLGSMKWGWLCLCCNCRSPFAACRRRKSGRIFTAVGLPHHSLPP